MMRRLPLTAIDIITSFCELYALPAWQSACHTCCASVANLTDKAGILAYVQRNWAVYTEHVARRKPPNAFKLLFKLGHMLNKRRLPCTIDVAVSAFDLCIDMRWTHSAYSNGSLASGSVVFVNRHHILVVAGGKRHTCTIGEPCALAKCTGTDCVVVVASSGRLYTMQGQRQHASAVLCRTNCGVEVLAVDAFVNDTVCMIVDARGNYYVGATQALIAGNIEVSKLGFKITDGRKPNLCGSRLFVQQGEYVFMHTLKIIAPYRSAAKCICTTSVRLDVKTPPFVLSSVSDLRAAALPAFLFLLTSGDVFAVLKDGETWTASKLPIREPVVYAAQNTVVGVSGQIYNVQRKCTMETRLCKDKHGALVLHGPVYDDTLNVTPCHAMLQPGPSCFPSNKAT